jgi:hypothetical protein
MGLATKRKLLILTRFEVQLQVFCHSVAGQMFNLWAPFLLNRIRHQCPSVGFPPSSAPIDGWSSPVVRASVRKGLGVRAKLIPHMLILRLFPL